MDKFLRLHNKMLTVSGVVVRLNVSTPTPPIPVVDIYNEFFGLNDSVTTFDQLITTIVDFSNYNENLIAE